MLTCNISILLSGLCDFIDIRLSVMCDKFGWNFSPGIARNSELYYHFLLYMYMYMLRL